MQKYEKTLRSRRGFPIFCNFAGKFNIQRAAPSAPVYRLLTMKYYEVIFRLQPYAADAADVLAAMAADAGFETFENRDDLLVGYVQQTLFDQQQLDDILAAFPFADTRVRYNIGEAEDRDWNEQWEQEGFEPIVVSSPESVSGGAAVIIHDGRHLPLQTDTTAHPQPVSIEIDARLAFGTGTHQTTRMVCAAMTRWHGRQVLDCGTGTGILAICALKLGAAHATAYDIDEWSVDNALHNSIINRVDTAMEVLHGDASLLDGMEQRFDLVVANINRNILLADMPRFVQVMKAEATLIVSGFYQQDCPLLTGKAEALGMRQAAAYYDGDWACLVFQRQ